MISYDNLGPEKIIEVYDSKIGLHGFVVIDNTLLGPGKGGIRMTGTVSAEEVSKLARAMTYKNSLAGLPFGGAKAGIRFDPRGVSQEKKDELMAAFSKAIRCVCPSLYVSGPDINTAEHEMQVFAQANGSMQSCTGKPAKLGGIPHELGSTGFGVYHSILVAVKHKRLDVKKLTFAVEGFGNVGWFVSKFLTEAGAKLVAVSDSKGTAFLPSGFEFEKLADTKKKSGIVTTYPGAKTLKGEDIVSITCDILVTAAIPDLLNESNKETVKAGIIAQGSNIPMTAAVEDYFHKKNILVIPDFVANAGGVISSYVEYIGGTPEQMFRMVEEKITRNTKEVLELADRKKIKPRDAAIEVALSRLNEPGKQGN